MEDVAAELGLPPQYEIRLGGRAKALDETGLKLTEQRELPVVAAQVGGRAASAPGAVKGDSYAHS